jgi:hypothetical protein
MYELATILCLMLVLMLRSYNTLERRTFEEWSSILDLSTRWSFTSIRELAIRCMKSPDPLNRLLMARKHAVEQWILPALLELCERPEPLSLEEARLMDFEDVLLVGSVRQKARSPTLLLRGAGIGNCIQAWKSGDPWSLESEPLDNLLHRPESNTTRKIVEQISDSEETFWGMKTKKKKGGR